MFGKKLNFDNSIGGGVIYTSAVFLYIVSTSEANNP